jgi:hypothetical protein
MPASWPRPAVLVLIAVGVVALPGVARAQSTDQGRFERAQRAVVNESTGPKLGELRLAIAELLDAIEVQTREAVLAQRLRVEEVATRRLEVNPSDPDLRAQYADAVAKRREAMRAWAEADGNRQAALPRLAQALGPEPASQQTAPVSPSVTSAQAAEAWAQAEVDLAVLQAALRRAEDDYMPVRKSYEFRRKRREAAQATLELGGRPAPDLRTARRDVARLGHELEVLTLEAEGRGEIYTSALAAERAAKTRVEEARLAYRTAVWREHTKRVRPAVRTGPMPAPSPAVRELVAGWTTAAAGIERRVLQLNARTEGLAEGIEPRYYELARRIEAVLGHMDDEPFPGDILTLDGLLNLHQRAVDTSFELMDVNADGVRQRTLDNWAARLRRAASARYGEDVVMAGVLERFRPTLPEVAESRRALVEAQREQRREPGELPDEATQTWIQETGRLERWARHPIIALVDDWVLERRIPAAVQSQPEADATVDHLVASGFDDDAIAVSLDHLVPWKHAELKEPALRRLADIRTRQAPATLPPAAREPVDEDPGPSVQSFEARVSQAPAASLFAPAGLGGGLQVGAPGLIVPAVKP